MLQPQGAVIEVAHVVDDLDAAIEQFGEFWGAGPFYTGEIRFESGHTCRGAESPLAIEVGFGFSGGLLIELIRPLDGDRSVFSHALAERGPGFHHIVRRESFETGLSRYEKAGYDKVLELTTAFGERTVLFDTTALNGGYLEVTDLNVTFEPLMATLSDAHAHWDGVVGPRSSLSDLFDYGAKEPTA
jgi:hypothetical protein